jgi:hypothetical protein
MIRFMARAKVRAPAAAIRMMANRVQPSAPLSPLWSNSRSPSSAPATISGSEKSVCSSLTKLE